MHTDIPFKELFETRVDVIGNAKTRPSRLVCLGRNGPPYVQPVKRNDNLRQDAAFEEMFALLNKLFSDPS